MSQSQWPGVDMVSTYSEGLLIGYRWYDAHNETPAYPFGHGLSYTTFGASDFVVQPAAAPGGPVEVSLVLNNTGARAGSEVVQVYLGFPPQAGEPPRQLKAFQKVLLAPAEAVSE